MKQNEENIRNDGEGLQALINLPIGSKNVIWEIASLPDSKNDDIPGPTDYVSLIALIYLDENLKNELINKNPPTQFEGFPDQFIRSWLPKHQNITFKKISDGEIVQGLIDARFLVKNTRPAKEAVGFVSNDTLILFVNYLSPN